MSNDFSTANRSRRTRQPRNRPVLVTSTGEAEVATNQTDELLEASIPALPTQVTTIEEAPAPKRVTRLPNFFSKVAKSDEEKTTGADEVVQARMARARASKKIETKEAVAAEASKDVAKVAPKPKKEAPPKLFKTRHIFGMMIYLLAAEFGLPREHDLAVAWGIEKQLFVIPSINLPISASFVINIASLLLLLYALVKLDLLPRSLGGAARARQNDTSNPRNNQNAGTPKVQPPVVRQGVQGEHDDLYRAYRTNQRREKKR